MKNAIMIRYILLVLFVFSLENNESFAQNKVKVVTRTIEKELIYQSKDTIKIIAEKANIKLKGWDNNTIQVKLELISKHTDEAIAKKEVSYLDYKIETNDNIHLINNSFLAPGSFKKVRGVLSARYEIFVPKNALINLSNYYGAVTLESLGNGYQSTVKFTKLNSISCDGDQQVVSFFGEVQVNEGTGKLKLNSQKTDVSINGFRGDLQSENYYGDIILNSDLLTSLDLNGNKTGVTVQVSNMEHYNYDFTALHAEIGFPSTGDLSEGDAQIFQKKYSENNSLLKIKTTYRPITLKLYYNASNK